MCVVYIPGLARCRGHGCYIVVTSAAPAAPSAAAATTAATTATALIGAAIINGTTIVVAARASHSWSHAHRCSSKQSERAQGQR